MSAEPGQQTPGSMLEVYMQALASRTHDDFLDTINLGVGNYSDEEYWQQMSSFRQGMFADAGMTRKLLERARYETKVEVVRAIFNDPESELLRGITPPHERDSDVPDDVDELDMTPRRYFNDYAESLWNDLGYTTSEGERYSREAHQASLVNQVTGIEKNWVPPQWRMLKARHEGSRSKDAHLIDNLFGRPPEPDTMQPEPMGDI